MYGLLIEGLKSYLSTTYSDDLWPEVLQKAGCPIKEFDSRRVYDEAILPKLFAATSSVVNLPEDVVKYETGKLFIPFLTTRGYKNLLTVIGRNLRQFINGLDNFHEYLRETYPKMRPPSFFCLNESSNGITLEYRSARAGYLHFFIGWMEEISKFLYQIEVKITIIGEINQGKWKGHYLRLNFDNLEFRQSYHGLLLPSTIFFQAFPFTMVYNRGLKLIGAGPSLLNVTSNIIGKRVDEMFVLAQPPIPFTWDNVIGHSNIMYEVVSRVLKGKMLGGNKMDDKSHEGLKLRGQMKYMSEWDAIVFLGTPILADVNAMWEAGLYLNDLSMHDSSRDMVLAGEQQSAELKLALEQESEKGKRLEENLKRLDEEMRRTDDLLYQMIPKAVAERLREGQSTNDLCQTFESITLLFSDVVGFTNICSGLTPLEVVELLNKLYSCFDGLTELNKVYKVETVGDAYMIASGCPMPTKLHALFIAEMALDMITNVQTIKDESKDPPESLRIRVGIHSGSAVAGVVGVKMPRYCLFGSTVATAETMEQTSAPQRIQISEATRLLIDHHNVYNIEPKGVVNLKDGEQIPTFWLNGRPASNDCRKTNKLLDQLDTERERLADSNMTTGQKHDGEGWESVSMSRCSSARTTISKRNSMSPSTRSSKSRISLLNKERREKRKSIINE